MENIWYVVESNGDLFLLKSAVTIPNDGSWNLNLQQTHNADEVFLKANTYTVLYSQAPARDAIQFIMDVGGK